MGGETPSIGNPEQEEAGLSPRGRGGNLAEHVERRLARGSIPAWAGKPGPLHRATAEDTVYPRVGGEP